MIGLLSLLFLEFIVYFGSNIFLKKFAQRKINEATENVYIIDFNRFSFSLIRRGFFLDGIVMQPVNLENRKEDQALFDMTLDQIAFRGLWYNFFEKKFTIGKIYIDNPNVKLDLPNSSQSKNQEESKGALEKEKVSPVKALEEEIKKTVRRVNLTGLFIREVEIDHANFFFFNFLSDSELEAENTSLLVRNIDFSAQDEWKTPFNAEGFEFELEKVTFPLPDGVHKISADRVFISSLDNLIDIQFFNLTPDRKKESKAYYRVGLEELRVGNVDLNKAFMTSILDIDELILDNPDFKVESNPKVKSDSAASGNLNDFIKGNLKSVTIKELSINKGKFIKSELEDTLKNRIELDELDFKMVGFYLGEDSIRRENQFFYGEDAAMDIKGSRVYLGDQIHILQGQEVSVSSFKDELIVRNLSILPINGVFAAQNPEKLLRIDLTEFSIEEVDLKKLYNEGILVADQILIYQPKVEFTELRKSTAVKGNQVPVAEIIASFMNEVKIRNFEVQDGLIQFKDERGQGSNNIGFEKFSFRLEDMELFAAPELSVAEKLTVGEIYLSLDKYRLKLRDNLHTILADKLIVDSKNQLLEVINLTIRPDNQEQIQATLDAYGKTAAIDFSVPVFRAEGIDIKSAFYDEKLFVRQIILPGPIFSISNYREKAKSKDSPESTDEVKNLLLGYFKAIQIDSLSLDKAQIKYQSLVENKRSLFEEDNFSLRLKNFVLDREALASNDQTLFSEEIDLIFNNYSFSLAGGKYEVTTDKLQYNSIKKSIEIKDLELVPNENFLGRIQLGLNFPKVSFKGVDIEQFFFENKLDLDKLEIDQGQIEIGIDRKIATKSKAEKQETTKKRALEEILIDTVQTKNSRLSINYQLAESSVNSIETDFDLVIRKFRLDSVISATKDVGMLYQEVNLNLNEFKFALPDSIHTVGFSKVDIGTLRDQIVFSDFYITPKDQFGKTGNPVLDAKIDQLILKNNHLAEIQETGIFDLKEIRMVNPKFNLYLDTAKVQKENKEVKEKSSTALVQSILLGDFHLENGELTLHRKGKGPIPRLDFKEIGLNVEDLNLNLLDRNHSFDLKTLAEKKAQFGLKNYSLITPDSLYKVDIGSVDYRDRNLILENIYYRPIDGSYALLRKLPFQTDAVTARVDAIRLTQIDLQSYLESNLVKADELIVESPRVDLFRDKRYPFDSSAQKPMPQFLLENAGIDADLVAFRIRNGHVRYFEFAPKGLVPGMISFNRIDVDMAPFYLRKPGQEYPLDQLRMGMEAHIMDTSKVNLDALMYFREKYPMDVKVRMDSFAFSETNDFLSKTLFIKALDGTVTDGKWNFILNDEEAIGEMVFAYTDLKIQFLDSLTLKQGMGKLKFYTFGANLLAKNSNPRSMSSRVVKRKIYQERDKRKFVFSAWWKASFSGLRGTVGLGRAKLPKRREEEAID